MHVSVEINAFLYYAKNKVMDKNAKYHCIDSLKKEERLHDSLPISLLISVNENALLVKKTAKRWVLCVDFCIFAMKTLFLLVSRK